MNILHQEENQMVINSVFKDDLVFLLLNSQEYLDRIKENLKQTAELSKAYLEKL